MSLLKPGLFIMLFVSGLLTSLAAQAVQPDTSSASGITGLPYLQTNFTKQSITWNWQNRFFYRSVPNSPLHWQVQDAFSSNIISPGSDAEQLKDEHRFSGLFEYRLPYVSPGVYVKSWYQLDKRASGNNRFANHAGGLYFDAHYLKPYLGYQQSVNRDLTENGWDLGLQAQLPGYAFDNYLLNVRFDGNYDVYENRQNSENVAFAGLSTKFSSFSGDSLQFGLEEVEKEYYVGGKLERVTISNRKWFNHLYYYLTPRDQIVLQTRVQSRSISYFNGRDVFNLDNSLQYTHLGRKFYILLQLRTNDQTQDNAGVTTDSRARQTALRWLTTWQISPRQQLNLDLGYVKLQYDTPDDRSNFDDRDELRFAMRLDYQVQINPFLNLQVAATSFLYRQMYIYAEQSSNNNWNRIFRLNPRLTYSAGRLRNTLNTEVLANYTVYDFDELLGSTRSFVFRKYVLSDSLRYRLVGHIHAGSYVRLELEDKGSFFEKQFAQQLLQSYQSEYYNFFILNDYFLRMQAALGYSFYRRSEWRHIPVKKRSRQLVNQGPFITLTYRQSQHLQFSANMALSYLDDDAYRRSTYSTGNLRLYYLF